MFQYGLSWPEARTLLHGGSYVRRERWTDKRLFRTAGDLVWVDASPARVVRAADFGRAEFLALDWTNMGFDQAECVDPSGWTTRLLIDESAQATVLVPATQAVSFGFPVSRNGTYDLGTITNPLACSATLTLAGTVDQELLLDNVAVEGPFPLGVAPHWISLTKTVAAGASVDISAKTYKGSYTGQDYVSFNGSATWTPPAALSSGLPKTLLSRTVANPFSAACFVEISGTATDALLINGIEVALPASFTLAAGASFTLAAYLRAPLSQPSASLDLTVDMFLE